MEQKRFYYVYQITNLVNGKVYVGMHATDDMEDGYMGSGDLIQLAIKKYGVASFRKDILFEGYSLLDIVDKEAELVTQEFIERDDTYNLCVGGRTGVRLVYEKEMARRRNAAEATKAKLTGVPRTVATKQKIAAAMVGNQHSRKAAIIRECAICGKQFTVSRSRPKEAQEKARCCSRSCTCRLNNQIKRSETKMPN